jgi:hypothetical protein
MTVLRGHIGTLNCLGKLTIPRDVAIQFANNDVEVSSLRAGEESRFVHDVLSEEFGYGACDIIELLCLTKEEWIGNMSMRPPETTARN